ncbi:MAG: hypothetical protein GXP35_15990 [Actinobacteria bacterium]|nr:hypothetical protein [Actinomycetota bacterium]
MAGFGRLQASLMLAVGVSILLSALAPGVDAQQSADVPELGGSYPAADDAFIVDLRDHPNFSGAWIDLAGRIHLAFIEHPGPASQFETTAEVTVHFGRSHSFAAMVAEQARILEAFGWGSYVDELRGEIVIEVPAVGTASEIDTQFPYRIELVAQEAVFTAEAPSLKGWLLRSDGVVQEFGSNASSKAAIPGAVAISATPSGLGYHVATADGAVSSVGDAAVVTSALPSLDLRAPIVDATTSPTGALWLMASDGGIFAFGGRFHGSLGALVLNEPVVAIASTPSGDGYWLVASDGGIFAFGDAGFHGSVPSVLPGVRLSSPIVGIAPTRSGLGYLLLATDGGVFAFGDAQFAGSIPDFNVQLSDRNWRFLVSDGVSQYALLDTSGALASFGFEQGYFPITIDLVDAAMSLR